MVRRSGEEDDDNDDGEINSGVFIISSNGGADSVRKRGQEDEEGEEVQGVVREREAQEGEEDWAHQGQGWGPQIHSLASPF